MFAICAITRISTFNSKLGFSKIRSQEQLTVLKFDGPWLVLPLLFKKDAVGSTVLRRTVNGTWRSSLETFIENTFQREHPWIPQVEPYFREVYKSAFSFKASTADFAALQNCWKSVRWTIGNSFGCRPFIYQLWVTEAVQPRFILRNTIHESSVDNPRAPIDPVKWCFLCVTL